MRLNIVKNQNATYIQEFANWIFKFGDENMDLNENEDNLEIAKELIKNSESSLQLLVQFVYHKFELNMMSL